HDAMVQGIVLVAFQRRAAVLVGDQAIPRIVNERLALIVGGRVAVVVEGERGSAGGSFFVLLVERVADRAPAVGGRGGEVAKRVQRPGDGVGGAADGIVGRIQRAAGEGDELVEVVVAVAAAVRVVEFVKGVV